MAKYYLVARNNDKYDLINVGDHNKIEEIDSYTLNFRSEKELIEDINSHGYNLSPKSDLFIIYKKKDDILTKELLYKDRRNYNIRENIDLSLKEQKLVCYFIFKEVFELSKKSDFSQMMNSPVYKIYKGFKDLVYDSHKDINQVKFDKNNNWLRSSYLGIRDLCILMRDYDKLKTSSAIHLKNKEQLNNDRKVIFRDLSKTLKTGFGQLSMIGGPENFIHITSINPKNIPNSHVLSGSKTGSIKPKETVPEIEVTKVPKVAASIDKKEYKLDMKSIPKINIAYQSYEKKQTAVKEMLKFLTNDYYMPSGAIKNNGDRYYLDFDVFNYQYSDEEKQELSSLLSQSMMKKIKGYKICNDRLKDPYLSFSSICDLEDDKKVFRKDIKRYLDKYAEKNYKSLNKIYRFCQVQKEVIDNTKGRSR